MTTKTIPQWFSFVCKNGKAHGHKPGSGLVKFYNEDYKDLLKSEAGCSDERLAEIIPGEAYTPDQIDAMKKDVDKNNQTCTPHKLIDSIEHSGGRVCRRCSHYLPNAAAVGAHFQQCKPGSKDEDQSMIAE